MPEVTDLMRVAQYVKSDRDAPSDVYNAACRMLDQPDELEWLRAELAKALTGNPLICCDERHKAKVQGLTVERDTLKATDERVRKALEDADWGGPDRGDVVEEIREALGTPEKATESHGDGRTPQTLGTPEGQEATEAQEGSQ